jgi:hypothetical protein
MEPLVEMNQHKGDSECRPGVGGATDELCGFEKNNRLQLFNPVSDPNQNFPALNYVRNALKLGLEQEQALGVNPFKLGLIGSTDTHNATPGGTEEQDFGANGHIGLRDHANPAFMLARVTPAGIEGDAGRARRRVGRGELARRALRGHAAARGLRHERQPADPALLRRPRGEPPLRRSRVRRDGVRGRRAHGRRHRPRCAAAGARSSASSRSRTPARRRRRARRSSRCRS